MVYGIRNIVSEEVQEKLDIASLYFDIMNEDYSLFGEDYITESFDIKEIKQKLTVAMQPYVDKFIELVGHLKDGLVAAGQAMYKNFPSAKYTHMLKKLNNVGYVAISTHDLAIKCPLMNNPKSAIEKEYNSIFNIMDHSINGVRLAVDKMHDEIVKISSISDDNWSRGIDTIDQLEKKIKDSVDEARQGIHSMDNFNTDTIFFDDRNPSTFGLNGNEIEKLCEYAFGTNGRNGGLIEYISRELDNTQDLVKKNHERALKDIDKLLSDAKENGKNENMTSHVSSALWSATKAESDAFTLFTRQATEFTTYMTDSAIKYMKTVNNIVNYVLKQNQHLMD